jgi:hypothetical protein
MNSPRAELAQRVLRMMEQGDPVSPNDAIHLRALAVSEEHAMLSLDEVAREILDQEANPNTKAAKQGTLS